jgi:hypothetical protein
MPSKAPDTRYRYWYAKLLRLYPKPHYQRFGEGMQQTFNDLLQERASKNGSTLGCAIWMAIETCEGIMTAHMTGIIGRNKRFAGMMLAIGCLLLLPLLGVLFTDEVNWGPGDFIIAGILLTGTALLFEVAARLTGNRAYRAAVALAVVTGLVLIWLNLAVGLIGSEDNPANIMYFGVLLIGFAGAIVARLRPHGMARALFATATAQALVPVIALLINRPPMATPQAFYGVLGVFILNTFFVMLFIGSAFLFRHAATMPTPESAPQ